MLSVVQAAKHAVEDAAEGAMEAVEPGREQVGEVSAAERRPSPLLPPIQSLGHAETLHVSLPAAGTRRLCICAHTHSPAVPLAYNNLTAAARAPLAGLLSSSYKVLGSRCTFPNPEICHLPPDLKVIQETESGEEEVEGDDVLGSAVRAVTGAAAVSTRNRLMYLRAPPPLEAAASAASAASAAFAYEQGALCLSAHALSLCTRCSTLQAATRKLGEMTDRAYRGERASRKTQMGAGLGHSCSSYAAGFRGPA